MLLSQSPCGTLSVVRRSRVVCEDEQPSEAGDGEPPAAEERHRLGRGERPDLEQSDQINSSVVNSVGPWEEQRVDAGDPRLPPPTRLSPQTQRGLIEAEAAEQPTLVDRRSQIKRPQESSTVQTFRVQKADSSTKGKGSLSSNKLLPPEAFRNSAQLRARSPLPPACLPGSLKLPTRTPLHQNASRTARPGGSPILAPFGTLLPESSLPLLLFCHPPFPLFPTPSDSHNGQKNPKKTTRRRCEIYLLEGPPPTPLFNPAPAAAKPPHKSHQARRISYAPPVIRLEGDSDDDSDYLRFGTADNSETDADYGARGGKRKRRAAKPGSLRQRVHHHQVDSQLRTPRRACQERPRKSPRGAPVEVLVEDESSESEAELFPEIPFCVEAADGQKDTSEAYLSLSMEFLAVAHFCLSFAEELAWEPLTIQ
ncbi:hypothetical protein BDK51DRAFT_27560, partial [Blyttiomyces helicus]